LTIHSEADSHVVLITIDRRNAMNALDPEHNAALGAAVEQFEADPALRVAVLTGAGDAAFCAGADLRSLIPAHRDAIRAGETPAWNFGGFTAREVSKPMIAAINGHALAGGLEIALACDLRLAAPHATLGLAETKWGIIPGAGGTQRLPRCVPLGIALEMIMTGEPISAAEAYRVGLVNQVVPLDRLLETALRLAATIADRGPIAVRAAREAVLRGIGLPLDEGLRMEADLFRAVMRTEDAVEGATAFAEKRPPEYRGQ
jgi:enoyl-CoA hydratase/carnithine racemase